MDLKYCMLLGETGAGKSTFINYLYNYSKKLDFQQRSVIIPNKHFRGDPSLPHNEYALGDNSTSKTTQSKPYNFIPGFSFLDTPGLGDTKGLEQDQRNIDNIIQNACNADLIHAIILIVNGSTSRFTSQMEYVLQKIRGFFPDEFQKNLIVVFTNASRAQCNFEPAVIKNIFNKWDGTNIYHMQNDAFSSDPNSNDIDDLEMLQISWKLSLRKVEDILRKITTLTPSQSTVFQAVKKQRDDIKLKINNIQNKIDKLNKTKSSIQDAKIQLANATQDIQQYSNYKQTKVVQSKAQETTPYHNTVCTTCSVTCHEHCGLEFTTTVGANVFSGCACMSGGNKCNVCGCGVSSHVHSNTKFVEKNDNVDEIIEEIKQKFDDAQKEKSSKEREINSLESDIKVLESEIGREEKRLEDAMQALKQNCSGFNLVDEFTSLVVKAERDSKAIRDFETRKKAEEWINNLKAMLDRFTRMT